MKLDFSMLWFYIQTIVVIIRGASMSAEDDLINAAKDLQRKILDNKSNEIISTGAVKTASKDYLDELIRELNQIRTGEADKSNTRRGKLRIEDIKHEIKLIAEANTGVKTPQTWKAWFKDVFTLGNPKRFAKFACIAAAAIAVSFIFGGPFLGVAVCLGVAAVYVAAVALSLICKGISGLWNKCFGSSKDTIAKEAQKELGLDRAATQGLAMRPMVASANGGVPDVHLGQNAKNPGAAAAQSNRFRK